MNYPIDDFFRILSELEKIQTHPEIQRLLQESVFIDKLSDNQHISVLKDTFRQHFYDSIDKDAKISKLSVEVSTLATALALAMSEIIAMKEKFSAMGEDNHVSLYNPTYSSTQLSNQHNRVLGIAHR